MASIIRGAFTQRGDDVIVRNQAYILGSRIGLGLLALVALAAGIAASPSARGAGLIAIPLLCGLFGYTLCTFGRHLSIQLGPHGVVLENGPVRHEFAWWAAPTLTLGRGLELSVPGGRWPVASSAFPFSTSAEAAGYAGHRRVLEEIDQARRALRERFPVDTGDTAWPQYRSRVSVPELWLLPVLMIAAELLYVLGLLVSGR
ncbi:hypothetical protein KDL01_22795 [Actinospica durhamensis]|uniref:PH domain-containing protein n=1 Tax=Actinospica durhamensis TaxID=1508375 RepID=A0A941ES19_9ACTN|nr:hypothetical protein [Actinospica durhamensis]MBR7836123.1 hypothetical protein [Actinospica durhamensis]